MPRDEGLDMSICLRCLMSCDWPKRLVEASASVRELVCETLRESFLTDEHPVLERGRCLAGRGVKHFRCEEPDSEGVVQRTFEEGSFVYPWSGSRAINTPADLLKSYNDRPRCSDFAPTEGG